MKGLITTIGLCALLIIFGVSVYQAINYKAKEDLTMEETANRMLEQGKIIFTENKFHKFSDGETLNYVSYVVVFDKVLFHIEYDKKDWKLLTFENYLHFAEP